MTILFTLIHIIVCLFLIVVVLLQSGKAADLAGAFGGMGSQTAFGPRGSATLLSKATTLAAAIFMVTSLTLAILATRGASTSSGSILQREKAPAKSAPAKSGTAPAGSSNSIPLQFPGQSQPGQAQPAQSQPAPAQPAPANKK
jgi:preprotein translocase subunit SecG